MRAEDALAREWLVSNGLGGFASGTVAQANTRRYHGLLVASLRPPLDRVVMVAKVDATVRYAGREYELATNEFSDSTVAPRGFEHLTQFTLDGTTPVWRYSLADATLEQRLWMAHGANTTYVSFTVLAATEPLELQLVPLCTYRDYHSHSHGGWALEVASQPKACRVTAFNGAQPYRLAIDRGEFDAAPDWYWNFHHRAEAERGLDTNEDLFRPGTFRVRLAPGETVTLTLTAAAGAQDSASPSLQKVQKREQALLRATPDDAPEWIRQLTLAADQFIVQRWSEGRAAGTSVIAGYPWFGDWGRDTMIALPGLALATARPAVAESILRTFAMHVSEGMLPNRFPDNGDAPEYNTVDATLWYFHAIDAFLAAGGDRRLLEDLFPVLRDIVEWHFKGTRYSIHVDPADGLLYAGSPGTQLTWMDAKIGDWTVTPRIGKAVEINALWHFALARMARWAEEVGDRLASKDYAREAARVSESFAEAFWFNAGGYLFDVVDLPSRPATEGFFAEPAEQTNVRGQRSDASLRPNQLFAVSLGGDLLNRDQQRAVVATCARHLLTPVGLRSLAPSDPRYAARYTGGPRERDAVYHQGTVWSWLLGPFALAHYRAHGDANAALLMLDGLAAHLNEGCLGTISEIFDGDAPHAPRGCFAQAWSVSETLRAWHSLSRARAAKSDMRRSTGTNT